ncbi:MAG: Asp23/Gls24 family envelope stress response protein [Rhabdochlamydiaceae bacterium]|nr:Asp23/Gls24 family envelope stress response protein [Rhabdochlamydiaceae bacterium]
MDNPLKRIDTKEVELPDTLFVRDIENKVFQSIIVQCLLNIEGIALVEGNLLDYFLGREPAERISGISVEQDPKTHSIQVKIEVSVAYGIVIPQKAEEIQQKIAEQLSELTGLHVSIVHVVFKSLITETPAALEQSAPQYSDTF